VERDPYDGLTELQVVIRRRCREAQDAGMTKVEARLFAESEVDVGLLRKLVSAGCPAAKLAGVLL
jgi:hypothetical protein